MAELSTEYIVMHLRAMAERRVRIDVEESPATKTLLAAADKLEQAEAVVAKLPKDGQGKPICPGDTTYASTGHEYKWVMRTDDEDGWIETGQGHKCGCWLSRDVALAVGTYEREAALAARTETNPATIEKGGEQESLTR